MEPIANKITDRDALAPIVERLQKDGRVVGFTNGVFDVLHKGHVTYLEQARANVDVLIVGVNEDDSVRRLKGVSRPINTVGDRMIVLAALASVDYVAAFPEDTPVETLAMLKPRVHMKAGDYDPDAMPETPVVRGYGGDVVIIPFVDGYSSTAVIEKLRGEK